MLKVISRKEARELGLTLYYTGNPCKHGHISQRKCCNMACLTCHNLGQVKWGKAHYAKNGKEVRARVKKHYVNNKDAYKASAKRQRARGYDWSRDNPQRVAYHGHKRRASKLQRTPVWSDLKEIKIIYDNCPKGYSVDHIIPLQGKLVSGLHVPSNLQYLTQSENCKKYNTFDPMTHEEPILC